MGTRYSRYLGILCGEDHPHAYGDKKDDQYLIVSAKGSSPRVWGQAGNMSITVADIGIIPTRMGTRYFP